MGLSGAVGREVVLTLEYVQVSQTGFPGETSLRLMMPCSRYGLAVSASYRFCILFADAGAAQRS